MTCSSVYRAQRNSKRKVTASCLAKSFINEICAMISCCGQLEIWYAPLPGVCIINMNFMVNFLCV